MIRSTTIVCEVLNKYDITPVDYCVADFIYKYTTREGYCTNSLSNIAEEIKMSTRSITNSVAKLCKKETFVNNCVFFDNEVQYNLILFFSKNLKISSSLD